MAVLRCTRCGSYKPLSDDEVSDDDRKKGVTLRCPDCGTGYDDSGRPEGSPDFNRYSAPVILEEAQSSPSAHAEPPTVESPVAGSPPKTQKFRTVRTRRGFVKVGPRPPEPYLY